MAGWLGGGGVSPKMGKKGGKFVEGECGGLEAGVVGYSPICQIGSATHSIDLRLMQTLLPSL